ncbi:DNA polymerase III subunit delta' [Caulobacter sp. 17J65-9]|uniref:DNA polymerase III subunit delta' n=1 Tax=Caulobacter sp. 17J65-9 TaxID=2709382 RepID=UPI0013CC429C|nr:DNA polymerase III subunit delta' [Caulobacter sp. 17J65-9]NEX91394.1 DNA polymerase III subunit delta' [Caulobacter sp. 17J65-9]
MAEAAPHPRDVYDWRGPDAPERAFIDALERGRLHHAWLLSGPEGVGKATFAYRAARRLLGAAETPSMGLLGAAPSDAVSRLITAQSHPDLIVLERAVVDGKTKKFISVDDARVLPEFFSKAPSRAAYRVAIVDAVDDMNINAANALLKTLEEPPERGVLFLVSHSPGKLLATIRSRCRRLPFMPWKTAEVAAFVHERAGVNLEDADRLAAMSGGAPGRALTLAGGPGLEFDDMAQALVHGATPPQAELQHLADSFRGQPGQIRFELFFERLGDAVRAHTTGQGNALGSAVERWASLWDKLAAAPAQADALNLDRADLFWSTIADLKALRA